MSWAIIGASVVSAGAGAYGSSQAANAQESAAGRAGDIAQRNQLANLQLQEPSRYAGYQAQNTINNLFGFQTSPYTTIGQLQNTMTRLGAKEAKAALKRGASFDDLQQMGTLGDLNAKQYKKFSKYLTPDQIMQLRTGPAAQATAPGVATGAPAAPTQPGDMSAFFKSPDYNFRRDESISAVDRMAASRGGALGGNALRAQTELAGNMASGEFNNWYNKLLGIANGGQAATSGAGNAMNTGTAAQMGTAQAQGDARASGIMGVTNSLGSAVSNGLSLYALQNYLRPAAPPTAQPPGFTPAPGMGIMPWGGP